MKNKTIITQEVRRRQPVVKLATKKSKTFASRIFGISLSSVKRWCKRYDETWESSHKPKSHPNQ